MYRLVGAITILKNMSSSIGRIIHDYPIYEMENKRCLKLETTNQKGILRVQLHKCGFNPGDIYTQR